MKNTLPKWIAPVWDYYKDLRFGNLLSRRYNHILLLLYWALYGPTFLFLEQFLPRITEVRYHPVYCRLDDLVPFCEWFAIPYYYWFVFLIGFGAFWFLWEPRAFRDFMWAIVLTYSSTVVIYLCYPTMQELRPVDIPRDNLLVRVVRGLYDFDTNTNVCPSIHVLGSFSVLFAGLHSKILRGVGWKLFFWISTFLITLSTVFLKQHSVIDIFAAIAVGALCYIIQFVCYPAWEKRWIARRAAKKQPSTDDGTGG